MESHQAVRALGAIANESRLAIFRLLVSIGPDGLSAGALAAMLDIAPSALSFHLKDLSSAGLLAARPDGRRIIYSANFSAMNELLGYLTANCCAGEACELDDGAPCC
ncbi:MAG: ArsR family transcriptional regulator [Variovorax sp.]|nr:MAG: ArsR family transcriptional regulator [Variovorax sp.]